MRQDAKNSNRLGAPCYGEFTRRSTCRSQVPPVINHPRANNERKNERNSYYRNSRQTEKIFPNVTTSIRRLGVPRTRYKKWCILLDTSFIRYEI